MLDGTNGFQDCVVPTLRRGGIGIQSDGGSLVESRELNFASITTEEKWLLDIGLPRHLDFLHVWTDVSSLSWRGEKVPAFGALGTQRAQRPHR